MIQDSEDLCAQCGTRQNAESNLTNTVFQVCSDVKCGHKFCSNCLEDLFVHQGKRQFACKRCTAAGRQVFVRRDKLSTKSLMETEVEKDVRVRRKVKAIYNKTRAAFPTAEAYKDYEEEVEDLIFNLVHDVDTDATQARIKKYAQQNEESIAFNAGKQSEEDQALERRIRDDDELLKRRVHESRIADEEDRIYRRERKRQVNELMLGERDSVQVTKESLMKPVAGPANAAVSNQQMLVNQQNIFMLLNPREAPKAIKTKTFDRRALQAMKKEDIRRMHAASGYDHALWFRKSWREICECIGGDSVQTLPAWDDH